MRVSGCFDECQDIRGDVMCIVQIKGRDALPIWLLPDVTARRLSPDMLLKRLVNPNFDIDLPAWQLSIEMQQRKLTNPTGLPFPSAFILDIHGIPSTLPPVQWEEIERQIVELEQGLTAQVKPRDEWIEGSIAILLKYDGSYVWLDEFESWYKWFIESCYLCEKDEDTKLCYNPMLLKKHAQHFKDELAELTPKAPLKKIDDDTKKIQDLRIIASGAPTISLRQFIDCLLAEAIGSSESLTTFFRLVEEYGLVVYDKVVDGQIVSSSELLESLRQRNQQQPHDFMSLDDQDFMDGKDLTFWEPLKKEGRYQVLRDDVATAYYHANEPRFPWLNLYSEFVWLDVNEYANIDFTSDFGLPAKPEDYQDAFQLADNYTTINTLRKIDKRKRGPTPITTFLTKLCQEQDINYLSGESLIRAIKPLVDTPNCPVKKYHGFYKDVSVEWKPGKGSPKGSWGSKKFQNFVSEFKKQELQKSCQEINSTDL